MEPLDPSLELQSNVVLAPAVGAPEAADTVVSATTAAVEGKEPVGYIFSECERVTFSEELAGELEDSPVRLADAIPDADTHETLAWGVGEALRTISEALELARTAAWQDWSLEACSFRWHHAGRAELNL